MYTSENLGSHPIKTKQGTDIEEILLTLRDRGNHLEKHLVRLKSITSKLSDEPNSGSELADKPSNKPAGHLAQFDGMLEGFAVLLSAIDREILKLERII